MNRILIAEDEHAQQVLYEHLFRKAGYDPIVVGTADSAVAKALTEEFACIILDIRMPGMDGIEGMQRILAAGKQCPIVLHTAYSTYKDNFLTWSADAYIVKSTDPQPLLDAVARLTSTKE